MAGTNAAAVKLALIAAIQAAPPANTTVDYGYVGKSDQSSRQYIWGGKSTIQQDYSAMTSGRKPRNEIVVVELHMSVYQSGGKYEDTDASVVALSAVVENLIAGDPQLAGAVTGLRYGGIQGAELDNSADDDGVESHLTYQIVFKSRLF